MPVASIKPKILTLLFLFAANAHAATPGDLDPAFGESGDGIARPQNANGFAARSSWAVTASADGSFYALGEICEGDPPPSSCDNLGLYKFDSAGKFDSNFGAEGTGIVRLPDALNPQHTLLESDAAGRIYVVYQIEIPETFQYKRYYATIIERRLPDGNLDPSFNTVGRIAVHIQIRSEDFVTAVRPLALAISESGILTFVAHREQVEQEILHLRYDENGAYLWAGSVALALDIQVPAIGPYEIKAATNAAGATVLAYRNTNDTLVVRRISSDGKWDATFGEAGTFVLDSTALAKLMAGAPEEYFSAAIGDIAIDASGRTYIAGEFCCEYNPIWSNYSDWLGILRLTQDGLPDSSYGASGTGLAVEKHTLGSFVAGVEHLAVKHDNGAAVVSALRFYNADGFLDFDSFMAWFDADGLLDTAYSSDPQGVRQLTVTPDGEFLPSGDLIAANWSSDGGGVAKFVGSESGDSAPDAFAFAERLAYPNELVESETIIPEGFDLPVDVVIEHGEFQINAGAWQTDAATLAPGDSISVRHVAASAEGSTSTTTLTIGGTTGQFSSRVADLTPDEFAFSAVTNTEPGVLVESNTVEINGIELAVQASVSGGLIRVNDGAFVEGPVNIETGDQLTVQLTASNQAGELREATVSIGNMTRHFAVTTKTALSDNNDTSGGGAELFLVFGLILISAFVRRRSER